MWQRDCPSGRDPPGPESSSRRAASAKAGFGGESAAVRVAPPRRRWHWSRLACSGIFRSAVSIFYSVNLLFK